MKRRRSLSLLGSAFLVISLINGIWLSAQPAPVQVRPTEKPFLWRIDGPVPSYLYGTVHVPDSRVLELPEVVRKAFDAADVFNAEIPLDDATQATMLREVMLPPGQDLRKLIGDDVFARVVKVVEKFLGNGFPAGAAELVAMMLSPMKPWAVMSQVELLEFIPDITAGRQPLDAMLYGMAQKAGKEVGSLETVADQIAVFEGFTNDEQVKMLVSAMDDLEKPRPGGISPTRELVDMYLSGDLNQLAAELNKQYPDDEALNKKIIARVVTERNLKMAAKIGDLCAKKPAKSYFFAVGALHYAGETGIVDQLTKKGFKITRLRPGDAASIVRKPAA